MTVEASLDFPTFKGTLTLSRAPRFLRFTVTGPMSKGKWGALDRLESKATPGDLILVGELLSKSQKTITKPTKGRTVGEVIDKATYRTIDDGPAEAVLESNKLWQEWCLSRVSPK